jgi:hypothetical protein
MLTIGVSIGNYADTKYLVGVEIGKVTEKSVSSWDAFAKLKIVAQIVEMSTNIVVGDAVVRVMSLVSQVTAILRRQCRSDDRMR